MKSHTDAIRLQPNINGKGHSSIQADVTNTAPTHARTKEIGVTAEKMLRVHTMHDTSQGNASNEEPTYMAEINPEILMKSRMVLAKHWRVNNFKPEQERVIRSILKGGDVFAVLPTGAGKSACFQVPAMMHPGTAIVISPLRSLMDDQVENLLKRGIRAARLGSDRSRKEEREALQELGEGTIKLFYVSPECLVRALTRENNAFGAQLRHLYTNDSLSYMVVDEAHCVSDWGTTFRREYSKLKIFRDQFPEVPQLCFTATASRKSVSEVAQNLGMKSPVLHRVPPDRANLHLACRPWESHERTIGEMIEMIQIMLMENDNASAIIYATLRKECDRVVKTLTTCGIAAVAYHGGMTNRERKNQLRRWLDGELHVVVGTIACGMGIDKANVRLVLHYHMPSSMERYAQEVGRGGRDGGKCRCVAYVARKDGERLLTRMQSAAATLAVEHIVNYFLDSTTCRRIGLLTHFGDPVPAVRCDTCDVCCGEHRQKEEARQTSKEDCTRQAVMILRTVESSTTGGLSRSQIARNARNRVIFKGISYKMITLITDTMISQGYLQCHRAAQSVGTMRRTLRYVMLSRGPRATELERDGAAVHVCCKHQKAHNRRGWLTKHQYDRIHWAARTEKQNGRIRPRTTSRQRNESVP